MGENEGEGETGDDDRGRDEPPQVEWTRPIFERGKLIGAAVGEQGVRQGCQNECQSCAQPGSVESDAERWTITHRRAGGANLTTRRTRVLLAGSRRREQKIRG